MATKKTDQAVIPERLEFTDNGAKYILEFDRETAMETEKLFDISLGDIRAGKLSSMEGLFYGAFLKHHPNIKQTTMDKFKDRMGDKMTLYRYLAGMFAACVESLLSEPDEGNAISWTTI